MARYLAAGEKALSRETLRRRENIKINKDKRTFVCMLDLSQAFDRQLKDRTLIDCLEINMPIEVTTLLAKVMRNTACDTAGGIRTFRGV